ncbi:flavin-containing monooxygenase [Mycobacterium colombiense]|uniref:flavin-containing monooxygenase n=1 Tax=Mycobacterium colombiense TaxID=339268 RepID=UPI00096C1F14|nr:NAD(P)/FAD-dependent oxidoreductase [Mycobacterium colombiense]OMC25597.1 FAD-dependent oxidoreductase [Mycobacterium colombiense]
MSDPIVIIGAGAAGISVALSLKDRGVRPVLVDRADGVAAAWRSRYDRLKLNTGRQFSHLPGRPYPAGTSLYPARDDVVDHLERHAHEDGIDVHLNTAVTRIDRNRGGWTLTTSDGDLHAAQVVVATGFLHTPVVPRWPGTFGGDLLHSSEYRNPAPYDGKRVLVVGSGSSGMEIAHDLTTGAAEKVWLSVRTPPNLLPRNAPAGLPIDVFSIPLYHLPVRIADPIAATARRRAFGDLSAFGLPLPAEGPFARAHRLQAAPSVLDMEVIDAVRDNAFEVVSAVTALDHDHVVLCDGSRIPADVVICATGYHPNLAGLVGHLGVLTPQGSAAQHAPAPAAQGLYLHGLVSRPGLIGYVAKQSRALARRICA